MLHLILIFPYVTYVSCFCIYILLCLSVDKGYTFVKLSDDFRRVIKLFQSLRGYCYCAYRFNNCVLQNSIDALSNNSRLSKEAESDYFLSRLYCQQTFRLIVFIKSMIKRVYPMIGYHRLIHVFPLFKNQIHVSPTSVKQ